MQTLKIDLQTFTLVSKTVSVSKNRDYKSKTPGSVTRLLTKHDLPTLQERREDLRLTFLYKVVGGGGGGGAGSSNPP